MKDYLANKIILAPMAGGPGTPELVAEVCNAGGLGSIPAAYLTPDQITDKIRQVRALTNRPFAVNLFAGGYATEMSGDPAHMLDILGPIHQMLDLPAPTLPPLVPNPFPEQLEAVLEARPAVFSFTFGVPDTKALTRLREKGIAIIGTATTVGEGRILADAGVDAVVAQGAEAGAHRGTFAVPFESAMVPTLDLVAGIAPFMTVIGSGGIMDRSDVMKMLANGASAVQLGTAFLTCPESGASLSWKQALLAAESDTTELTRAFSGRHARGLRNAFVEKMKGRDEIILPFPVQNALTRPMRTAAAKRGLLDYQSLWAGQGVARCQQLPARDLVDSLLL